MNDIVIGGGGHAGVQLCGALAAAGQGARVHLVCEEPVLPYHALRCRRRRQSEEQSRFCTAVVLFAAPAHG